MAHIDKAVGLFLICLVAFSHAQFFDYLPSSFYQPTSAPNRQGFPFDFIFADNTNNRNFINNNNNNNNNFRTNNYNNEVTTRKYEQKINNVFNKDIPFTSFVNVPQNNDNGNSFVRNNNNNRNYFTTNSPTPSRKVINSSQRNKNDRNDNDYNRTSNTNTRRNKKPNVNREIQRNANDNTNNVSNESNRGYTNNYVTTQKSVNNVNVNTNRNDNNNNRYPITDVGNIWYNNNDQTYNNNEREQNNAQTTRKTTKRPDFTFTNREPITNRPVWTTTVKTNNDGFQYPNTDAKIDGDPVLVTGPNEDDMSEATKRRLVELNEKMCERHKALYIKEVQAIPLLPSPGAVRVNVSECVSPSPLVVGGKVVAIEEYPHSAALGWRLVDGTGYSYRCGGSLISDRYVLTAAHCAYQDRDDTIVSGPPTVVQLGSTYLNGDDAVVVRVTHAIRHPKYKLPARYYDIALLKLAERVRFTNKIKPACVGAPPEEGNTLVATGWGYTEFGGNMSQALRAVELPIWNTGQCQSALGTSRQLPQGVLEAAQRCAGHWAGGRDTCRGDSGGGLASRTDCAWSVSAVTSLGRGCAARATPAVYALPSTVFVASLAFH